MSQGQPALYLQYTIPKLQNVSERRIIAVEQSLLQHPVLHRYSVFGPPSLVEENGTIVMTFPEAPASNDSVILDRTNPDRKAAIADLLAARNKNNLGIKEEIEIISAAIQSDESLAWTWHSGVAMSCVDEGMDAAAANRAAARFMYALTGVNTTLNPAYAATQPGYVRSADGMYTIQTAQGFNRAFAEYVQLNPTDEAVAALPQQELTDRIYPSLVTFSINRDVTDAPVYVVEWSELTPT